MILRCFAVFDTKAAVFSSPFFTVNAGVAVRSFTDAVNSRGTDLNLHPEDYTLMELGTLDDGTGVFESTKSVRPEVVCTAASVLKVERGLGPVQDLLVSDGYKVPVK